MNQSYQYKHFGLFKGVPTTYSYMFFVYLIHIYSFPSGAVKVYVNYINRETCIIPKNNYY